VFNDSNTIFYYFEDEEQRVVGSKFEAIWISLSGIYIRVSHILWCNFYETFGYWNDYSFWYVTSLEPLFNLLTVARDSRYTQIILVAVVTLVYISLILKWKPFVSGKIKNDCFILN
jgi:hypothetical protein